MQMLGTSSFAAFSPRSMLVTTGMIAGRRWPIGRMSGRTKAHTVDPHPGPLPSETLIGFKTARGGEGDAISWFAARPRVMIAHFRSDENRGAAMIDRHEPATGFAVTAVVAISMLAGHAFSADEPPVTGPATEQRF